MALRDARLIDDKIVYALNNSIPTVSFKGQGSILKIFISDQKRFVREFLSSNFGQISTQKL
jgi:hypothetical protein